MPRPKHNQLVTFGSFENECSLAKQGKQSELIVEPKLRRNKVLQAKEESES
jgi:hypothetical protein